MLWSNLRSSLWFVPGLIVLGAVALAVLLIDLEGSIGLDLTRRWPRLFGAGADGARGMLTALASSMITVAGVVFSVTIVVLSLAASQYTSRVLRTFMSNRTTQAVLGVFIGIFAYCVVVLRTIRGGDDEFVPSIAVFGAVVLSFVGIAFLVYFIHHLASMIQATHILASVREETTAAAARLFPDAERLEDLDGESSAPAMPAARGDAQAVIAQHTGYIQAVDLDRLLECARRSGCTVAMERGVGEFVISGESLARVWMPRADGEVDEGAMRRAWTVNRYRTVDQDPSFGIRQIVDVALKALSPGINDTTTAIYCLDQLSAILLPLGRRRIAPAHRYDGAEPRVIARGPSYGTLVEEAFDEIRRAAREKPVVLRKLLDVLALLAEHTPAAARRRILGQEVERVAEMMREGDRLPAGDRGRVLAHAGAVQSRLAR